MTCYQCYRRNRETAAYCGRCGADLSVARRKTRLTTTFPSFIRRLIFLFSSAMIGLFCLPYATIVAGNLVFHLVGPRTAIGFYSFACSLNRQSSICEYDLAVALHKIGDFENAIYHYRRAITLGPSDPEFYNGLGLALQRTGDNSGAARAFSEALRLQPG